MKIFGDCANLAVMRHLAPHVLGYTTNPTLMRQSGVTSYEAFAQECVDEFPEHSLSFEVIADDIVTMMRQAYEIGSWGPQVYVKIPVSTTKGESTAKLVRQLTFDGVRINVTAVFSPRQVSVFSAALDDGAPAYLSIFAGRIADTGHDPAPIVADAAKYAPDNVSILWASAREAFNVKQAFQAGADIITLTPDLLEKYRNFGKDLELFSRETVQMFYRDACAAGLEL